MNLLLTMCSMSCSWLQERNEIFVEDIEGGRPWRIYMDHVKIIYVKYFILYYIHSTWRGEDVAELITDPVDNRFKKNDQRQCIVTKI